MQTQTQLRLSKADIEGLPNYRKRGPNEYSSACPSCGGDPAKDTDRFRFWPDVGNYWCRKCDIKGFVQEQAYFTITPEMMARREADKQAAKESEAKRKQRILERLQRRRNDKVYHQQLLNNNERLDELNHHWGLLP